MTRPRFHLAFPVRDLDEARRFYGDVLGCPEGRSSADWVDFDWYGHQIVAHRVSESAAIETHDVDGEQVPVRHFGLILEWNDWEAAAARLRAAGVPFVIEPYVRFAGQSGEQGTLFVVDPSGNAIELKSFRDEADIFRR